MRRTISSATSSACWAATPSTTGGVPLRTGLRRAVFPCASLIDLRCSVIDVGRYSHSP
ncbi:MAG: hypothetical protein WC824_09350 [Bacteroidota bacterium]